MRNYKCLLVLLIVACLGNTKASGQVDDRGYIVNVGQMAPDFSVTMADGKVFRLSENRGKIIMLQFTASWCSVCRKEMPHIEKEIWMPLKNKNTLDFSRVLLVGPTGFEPVLSP